MSVGVGIKGREVAFQLGGAQLLGVLGKNGTMNNTRLSTTDDDSAGWEEALASSGVKSFSFSVSGTFKNLELINAYFQESQIFASTQTFPDGSTLTSDLFMDNFNYAAGSSDELYTFDASFSSSGQPVFTAGT